LSPRQLSTAICDVGDPDLIIIDVQNIAMAPGFTRNFAREFPVDGIVFEKVGEYGYLGSRIDGDNLDVIVCERGPDQIPADAAETIYCAPNTHVLPPGR
jgi:hypothetical protein